jgi:antibiotic biosynthesis monooxygenase (ABM) superfamily enzyme
MAEAELKLSGFWAVKLLVSNILAVAAVSWITLPLVRLCIGWWLPDSPDRSSALKSAW